MFVGFWFRDIGEVENHPGIQHRFRQRLLLGLVHAIEVDSHQQSADLIISNLLAGYAPNEEIDLLTREMFAIPLFPNNVLRSQVHLSWERRHPACCVTNQNLKVKKSTHRS